MRYLSKAKLESMKEVRKKKAKRRYYRRTQRAENERRKWTEEEIQMIMERKYSDRDLSDLLGRSMMSIQCKRSNVKHENK